MITGTIKSMVNMTMMNLDWEQKKKDLNSGKKRSEMTEEERELQFLQEQVEDINKNKGAARIDAKLQAGEKLTQEEIEYLRKHNPQALKEYEKLQQERKSYEKQLRRCKTKEEVEKLKVNKMGEYLSQAKKISNNPYIPKAQKIAELKKILYKVAGVNEEHQKFLQSAEYAALPEDEKERKKRKDYKEEDKVDEKSADEQNRIAEQEEEVDETEEKGRERNRKDSSPADAEPLGDQTADSIKKEIKSLISEQDVKLHSDGRTIDLSVSESAEVTGSSVSVHSSGTIDIKL